MRRLHFLIPDAEITERVVKELLLAGIPERQIHIVAKDHELLQDSQLPEAGLLEEPRVVPAIEKGLAAGGAAGLLAGLVAVTFPPAGLALGGGALLGAMLGGCRLRRTGRADDRYSGTEPRYGAPLLEGRRRSVGRAGIAHGGFQ